MFYNGCSLLTHRGGSCEACYGHVSIRRALPEELFTDPVFRSMCFNRFNFCNFFLMDTNSIYSVSPVQWERFSEWSFGISLLSCLVWQVYIILYRFIAFILFKKKLELSRGFPFNS